MARRIRINEFIHDAPAGVGQQVHINHTGCPAGTDRRKRLYIKRLPDRVVCYCHNCGGSGVKYTSEDRRSLQTLRELRTKTVEHLDGCTVPEGTVYDLRQWPKHALDWVLQYGLTTKHITTNRMGYSPVLDRVVLPVLSGDSVVFWQARRLRGEDGQKYMSSKGHTKPKMFLRTKPNSNVWAVVEDYISAIKVADVCNVCCLFGTVLDSETAMMLKSRGASEIRLWLDGDTAGASGAVGARKTLQLHYPEFAINIVHSETQPKETDLETIERLLK